MRKERDELEAKYKAEDTARNQKKEALKNENSRLIEDKRKAKELADQKLKNEQNEEVVGSK